MIFKKFFAQIILICFIFSFSSVACAELQGELYGGDGIVTEDGETFNVGEFDKALKENKIGEAESIYNEWFKRRQAMLNNGTQYGIFDAYLKHCYARILCEKKLYKECIAVEDEILNYLQANLNENNIDWLNLIYWSMYLQKSSYDELEDYTNGLRIQEDIVNFMKPRWEYDSRRLSQEKMHLSFCYYIIKDYKKAIEICENEIEQFEEIFGSEASETRAIKLYLAKYYQGSLRYSDAAKVHEEVLKSDIEVYGTNSDKVRDVKLRLAQNYEDLSKYTDAAKIYEEVLQTDIEVYGETDEKTLGIYNKLITMYNFTQRLEEMKLLLERVVPIAEKTLPDDSSLKRAILFNQAYYYSYTRQFQKASEIYDKILSLPIGNDMKIYALCYIADDYRCFGDYSNALKHILKAWDIYEKYLQNNKEKRVDILDNMIQIYIAIGNTQEAVKFAQELVELCVELYGYDSTQVFWARNILAVCYYNMKQYDKALELWKENYALSIKFYDNDIRPKINSMQMMACVYYQLGNYKSGMSWAKRALDESIKLFGDTQGSLQILAAFYAEDKKTLGEAIKIFEMTLNEAASQVFSEQDPLIEPPMLSLAALYRRSSRWKEAIPLYEKVINSQENRVESYSSLTADEKRKLFSNASSIYVRVADLYCRDNKLNDAFRTLERGRARLLIDSYSEQLAKSSGILDEQEIVKLNEYKAGLANYSNLLETAFQEGNEQARFNLEAEQRKLSDEYVQYKKHLQEKYPKYKNVSQANKLDFERDKKILPDDTVFVEFMVGEDPHSKLESRIFQAFIFDKRGEIHTVKIDAPENFLSQCNFYREILSYPNLQAINQENKYFVKLSDGNYKISEKGDIEKGSGVDFVEDENAFKELKQNLSKEIGEILLAPLKDKISNYSNLIISPDGNLNNIPFETLEFNDKLAIETFNISYVPSFAVLKLMHEAGEKNSKLTNRQDLFAMGNAFYGNSDESESRESRKVFLKGMRGKTDVTDLKDLKWKNLEGTQEEINRVSELFGTKKIFTEKSASESNLKLTSRQGDLSKYRYLLFSTHGIFLPYAPEYSSIVLSQGVDTNEDGYVTIGEWMGLNLNSDLVVLSACESGLGEYQAGEGIVGIPYAFDYRRQ